MLLAIFVEHLVVVADAQPKSVKLWVRSSPLQPASRQGHPSNMRHLARSFGERTEQPLRQRFSFQTDPLEMVGGVLLTANNWERRTVAKGHSRLAPTSINFGHVHCAPKATDSHFIATCRYGPILLQKSFCIVDQKISGP